VLVVAAGAWWGCVAVGCAWGREIVPATDGTCWFTALLPNIYQTMTPRYAVQPLGAGWAVLLALLAAVLGERGGVALALYWLGSAGLTWLRADPMPLLSAPTGGNLRLDTVLDLVMAISIAFLTLLKTKGTHRGRTI